MTVRRDDVTFKQVVATKMSPHIEINGPVLTGQTRDKRNIPFICLKTEEVTYNCVKMLHLPSDDLRNAYYVVDSL